MTWGKSNQVAKLHFTHPRQSTRSLVHQDRNGTIWLATEEGFFGYYDEQNQLLVPAQIRTNAAMPSLDRWFEDSYGNIWFSGEHDLALINFGQHVFNHVTLNGMQQIRSVCYDSQNRLWAGDLAGHIAVMNEGNQLIGYLATDGKIRPQLSTFSSHIYCLYEDSQRRMWIGTKGDGLYCLHPNGSINHYRHDEANPYSLCSDQVYDVHEDSKHRIWIGTFEKGICLMQTMFWLKIAEYGALLSASAKSTTFPSTDTLLIVISPIRKTRKV